MAALDQPIFQEDFNIVVADLTAAATTQTLPLRLPRGNVILWGAVIEQIEAFGGGGAASCVARVGSRSDVDALCDDVNVFTGQDNGNKQDRTNVDVPQLSTTVDIIAQVTADVNVSLLTTGSMRVKVYWSPIQ